MKVGRRKECFESRVMEEGGVELSSSAEAAAGARWVMSPAAETSEDNERDTYQHQNDSERGSEASD